MTRPCSTCVLPARAGMVPQSRTGSRRWRSAPRSRGDGPRVLGSVMVMPPCSPLARGWSVAELRERLARLVLPARAGMVRSSSPASPGHDRAPRSRGDGPLVTLIGMRRYACSPLARGWSVHAARPCGQGEVLPARAGMVPSGRSWRCHRCSAPRSRGDGPSAPMTSCATSACSPLARGWSHVEQAHRLLRPVLPARAGMVPPAARCGASGASPATRCSPLARGWSRRAWPDGAAPVVLPARAGMVPGR